MLRWMLAVAMCVGSVSLAGAQQVGNGVNQGLNSDGGAMTGPNIDRVLGTNPNGTPRQQNPGSSMTNGAGNSTMTPGVTGPTPNGKAPGAPPAGIAIPQIVGQPAGQ